MRHIKLDYPTKTSDTIEVTCPYDGETIATVEVADASIVEQALTTANNLFKDRKRWLPQPRRVEILQRVAELMKERAEALAQDAAAEGGKPLLDSRVEVARAIDGINICIETLRSGGGEVIPMDVNAASAGRLAFTSHEPIGVVVAV
ncbi:MAG: aldehyde dehydrogenase family protein, partial [Gammaproteobacteria bacterium]|nr:aldehyde dehydrogenase family protein [Gammaproteobacteria bacterium]MBT5688098.1 aldehyde dehydrogenase family protein [Gammaproteobacteria bacterium]HIJ28544.1 aldehyde dehydrogenase family protein [Gammaproteobacteria bacterium]